MIAHLSQDLLIPSILWKVHKQAINLYSEFSKWTTLTVQAFLVLMKHEVFWEL